MDAKDVLGFWKSRISNLGNRFTSNSRKIYLRELAQDFLDNNIDLSEARLMSTYVLEFLITHKGKNNSIWKKCVREDFENALYSTYDSKNDLKPTLVEKPFQILPQNKIITEWSKFRFGLAWSEEYCQLCHMVGHRYNLEFIKDVMDQDWVKTGQNVPEWFKNLKN